ncbi:MAG: hypothetical protein ACKVZH_20565 [Blastocatellia bacterium]
MQFKFAPCFWRTAILCASAFLFAACADAPKEITSDQPASKPNTTLSTPPAGDSGTVPIRSSSSAPEVSWTAPLGWESKPPSQMRAATYIVPAAKGDSEGGECAVFDKIGGGVQANIDRWIGQFEQADGSSSAAKAKQKKETINGLPVTTVDLTGTFAGGGMAMGQPATKKPDYRLLGAIVEAPSGEVFFKLTGPAKTIAAAQADFQAMLKSIKK